LKISNTDRRYSVFKAVRALKDIAINDFKYEHVEQFVNKVEEESNGFIVDLYMYSYDKFKAKSLLENGFKKRIVEGSATKTEIIGKELNEGDFESLKNRLEDAEALLQATGRTIYANFSEKIAIMKEEMKNGYVSVDTQVFIYKYLVNEDDSVKKIAMFYNKILSASVSRNGKRIRKLENKYKEENSDIIVEMEENETIDEEEINKIVEYMTEETEVENEVYVSEAELTDILEKNENGNNLLFDIMEKEGKVVVKIADTVYICECSGDFVEKAKKYSGFISF
jgi:predicted transcriptional regulator